MKLTAIFLLAGALSIGAATSSAPDADAQVVVTGGVDVGVGVYPPAAYVATYTPEYYENRPVYYYNNYWYYRDHGRWSYYRTEPRWLGERRSHWAEHRYHERVVREPVRYRYRR